MIRLQHVLALVVLGVAVSWLVPSACADEKKSDPVGTWKWSITNPNGQTREMTVKVTKDGDSYSVVMVRRNGETKADKVEFKDGKLSFEVTRERQGQKVTTKYKGKVEGDTLKGKIEIGGGDNARKVDWEAKREKD